MSSSTVSRNKVSLASPGTLSRPISSMAGTASGETWLKAIMPDSSANALQELVKAADIDESGCRVSVRRAKKNVVGLVLAEHVINQVP